MSNLKSGSDMVKKMTKIQRAKTTKEKENAVKINYITR